MALDAQTTRRSLDVLVTRNLTMRPPLDVDAESITEGLSDATVARNLSSVPQPYGMEDAQDWLLGLAERPDDIVYTVHRERLIGVVAVHLREDLPTLGYWFRPCAWGKGYATQAGRAVLAQAFRILGCEAVRSYAYHDNAASLRVLEKLGFEHTGAGSQHNPTRGEDVATVEVRLTRAAFEARFGTLETDRAA